MDGGASGLAIAGATIQTANTAKEFIHNYKNAEKQISSAQHQAAQLRLTLEQLNDLPSSKQEHVAPAKASLNDIQEALPTEFQSTRKRDKLQWITGGKSKVDREISRKSLFESSATLNLLVSLSQDIQKLVSDSAIRHEELKSSLLYPTVVYTHRLISNSYIRERRAAHVRQWDWLAKYLGIKSGVIMSTAKNQNTATIFARWPLLLPFGLSQVITAQLLVQNGLPSLPRLRLRPQTIVSNDSEIISACESANITRIQRLFETRQAYPNDRTTDDFTVLRYAVLSGKRSVVQLLLDNGADPNLPFGIYETSPLDIAFGLGNTDIIRCLLRAGADLHYQNTRTWTALSYLWDPVRPAPASTGEILGICMSEGYSEWNEVDPSGWTPCHRAGAYGKGEDIYNLSYKGGNMRSYTTDFLWGPMTCAVWNNNESTFNAFMDLLEPEEVLDFKDSSGWTLLHLAAENGSRHMIKTLLDIGINPRALTVGPQHWLPKRLEWERLTAEAVAREYGHGELWDSVIMNTN